MKTKVKINFNNSCGTPTEPPRSILSLVKRASHSAAERPVWASTLRGLREPRRAVPIALVSAALLVTELLATRSPPATLSLGLFLVLFVLLVPATWRWAARRQPSASRLALYALLCAALVALTTAVLPALWRFESYVAHPPAAVAILVLAAMAGWVLGRDIDLAEGLQSAHARGQALTRETEDARLLALRQHLDPHFLFNTLGAIAEWCREDPATAERALLELSAMLRTLFDGIRTPLWPLTREVEILLALHHLYTLRDDERYVLDAQLDALTGLGGMDVPELPPLVLLPLFENALKHGAPGAPLLLRLALDDESVRVSLWNAGAFAGRRAGGTGIETVERRLALAYGGAASLVVTAEEREGVAGTTTRVVLPRRAQVASAAPSRALEASV